MFESVEEYNSIIAVVMSEPGEGPILEQYQRLIENIPDNLEDCKMSLCIELGITLELLDYSPGSIQEIDKMIKSKISRRAYFDKIYGSLLVYFGEAVRKQVNGEWGKRILEGIVEPFIITKTGDEIYYSKELNEQAFEDFKRFSVFKEFKIVKSKNLLFLSFILYRTQKV